MGEGLSDSEGGEMPTGNEIEAPSPKGLELFSSKIDDLMWAKRVRVAELIRKTGLSAETINRARKSETLPSCTLKTLSIIAHALGVKTKDLYEG